LIFIVTTAGKKPYGIARSRYTIKANAYDSTNATDIIYYDTLVDDTVLVTIQGDANGDGVVDIFDIGSISAHWYPGPPIGPLGYDEEADLNLDGSIDIFDIGICSAHWGETA